MDKRTNAITLHGNPFSLVGKEIKVGDIAPDFSALTTDLKSVSLSDYKRKTILISVFPSIDTGVCALQTKRFNDEAGKLSHIQIINISVDLPFALGRFCAAENINNSSSLSDHKNLDFGLKYGFVIEELRLLSRGVVVINAEGIVTYVEYVKEVSEHPDYEKVLKMLK